MRVASGAFVARRNGKAFVTGNSGFPKSQSCLKPSHETWWLAKAPGPLQPLQIDACRVPTGDTLGGGQVSSGHGSVQPGWDRPWKHDPALLAIKRQEAAERQSKAEPVGRWPPNTVLSHIGGPDGCQPAGVRRVRGITGGLSGRKGSREAVGGYGHDAVPIARYADADGYEQVQSWACVDGCPIRLLDEQAGPRTSGAKALHHVRTTTKVRRVRGARQGTTGGHAGVGYRIAPRERDAGYADADGCEQVRAYSCVPQCPVCLLDEHAGPSVSRSGGTTSRTGHGLEFDMGTAPRTGHDDRGGPSRFFPTFAPDPEDAVPYFYTPKASRAERNAGLEGMPVAGSRLLGLSQWTGQTNGSGQTMGPSAPPANAHPTVKPTALMAWLCKLVTKEGGMVLDCFGGSGSTGVAAVREGMRALIIEQDAHYCDIARARITHAEQQRAGPLFAGVAPSPCPDAAR